MYSFITLKRVVGVLLVISATLSVIVINQKLQLQLKFSSEYSGWLLGTLIVLLSLYNLRKRVPFLPLGDNRFWMQLHIYTGLFVAIVFYIHTSSLWPNGQMERWMAITFMVVVLSGVIGLILYRVIPPQLSLHDETIIFERIPALRWQIKKQIDDLVQQSIEQERSTTIADFYRRRLLKFISSTSIPYSYFSDVHQTMQRWDGRFTTMKRYLNPQELELFEQIVTLTHQKIELDYQYINQRLMKIWLFVHVPLTLSLLLLIVLHIIIVYAYL